MSLFGIARSQNDSYFFNSGLIFVLSGVMLAISHSLKEIVVRRQPLDMTNFNFKISIAQLCSLIVFTPAIMYLCKRFERFTFPSILNAQEQAGFGPFINAYVVRGFECITETKSIGQCGFSWLSVIGYVTSAIVIQISLSHVSCKAT